MLRNYIARICIALIVSCLLSWIAYEGIIFSNRKYVPIVKHNEHLFRDSNSYDILMLGTSRMKNGLDPQVIDSLTGLHAYNAGVGGSSAIEADMILQAYLLQNRPPKYVVLGADVLQVSTKRYMTVPSSYLSCDDIPPIRKVLRESGKPMGLYRVLPFLKLTEMIDYNRMAIITVVLHWRKKNFAVKDWNGFMDNDWNGFVNNMHTTIKKPKPGGVKKANITPRCLTALDNIIALCKQHNMKLIFVYAPEFRHYYTCNFTNLKEVMGVYYKRSLEHNIPFLRYDSVAFSADPHLFKDNSHMNATGARLYSLTFAQDLLNKGIIKR